MMKYVVPAQNGASRLSKLVRLQLVVGVLELIMRARIKDDLERQTTVHQSHSPVRAIDTASRGDWDPWRELTR